MPAPSPPHSAWWNRAPSFVLGAFLILVMGCRPAGPRAVLEGKNLLEHSRYAQAIGKLETANVLLGNTNAVAFNYLGLACQLGGQPAAAERAYRRALALDRELVEAHFNLGCLLFEQNKPEAARSELTAYTLKRAAEPEGWLQLGRTQLRLREASAAERNFSEAIRLKPQNPEAWTALGLARLQRNRPAEAAQCFGKALSQRADYAPALLNLAIVAQQNLHDPGLALRNYRHYLALKPSPDNSEAVKALVRELEAPTSPPPQPVNHPTGTAISHPTNVPAAKPAAVESPRVPHPLPLASSEPTQAVSTPKVEPAPPAQVKPAPPATTIAKPAPETSPAVSTVEVTRLEPEPVFKPAEDVTAPALAPTSAPRPQSTSTVPPVAASAKPAKRGLLKRLNPINLFAGNSTPESAPASSNAAAPPPATMTQQTAEITPFAPSIPRYTYRSPSQPVEGNHVEAQRWFLQAASAQREQRYSDAVQAYRRSTEADPAFFDAYYNLGLAASEAGDTELALTSYETALALRPDSLDARYNFALVLKQSKFMLDAANELEKLLSTYPNDSRAHLALGNLYAQDLQQPARARPHYLKVLETDPRNPQAPAIQYWLTRNPVGNRS